MCSRWGRIVPLPKLHSSITVWVSAKIFSRKWEPQRSLLVQPAYPSIGPEHSSVTSSWRSKQWTPQVGAVTVRVFDPGKVVSGSPADSVLSQVTESPLIFTTRYSVGSSYCLCCSGLGCLCGIQILCSCGEGVLPPRYPSSSLATVNACGEPALFTSPPFLPASMWLLL